MDLEAIEMLMRSAMHQAGASALTELLRFPEPEQRAIPCACGQLVTVSCATSRC